MPMLSDDAPNIGQCLYLPVTAMRRPVEILMSVTPTMMGTRRSPELVGENPVMACK